MVRVGLPAAGETFRVLPSLVSGPTEFASIESTISPGAVAQRPDLSTMSSTPPVGAGPADDCLRLLHVEPTRAWWVDLRRLDRPELAVTCGRCPVAAIRSAPVPLSSICALRCAPWCGRRRGRTAS